MRFSLRFIIIVVLALLFLGGPSLLRFYTDWLWFGEVGYQQVFTTIVRSEASLFTITFVIAVLWLVFNLRLALGSMRGGRPIFTTQQGIEVALPGPQQLRTIASAIAMILSALIGLYASSQWETWVMWRNAVPFGQQDPILGYDISFYIFTIPFLQFVRGIAQTLVIMAALGAGAIYALSGMVLTGPFSFLSMTPTVRRHIALLAAVFLLLLAGGAWLGRFELLAHPAGIIYGASYADVHARMPVALVLSVVSVLGAVLAVVHALLHGSRGETRKLRDEFDASSLDGLRELGVVIGEVHEGSACAEFLPLKEHRGARHQEHQRGHRPVASRRGLKAHARAVS